MNQWNTEYFAAQKRALDSIPSESVLGLISVVERALEEDRQIFVFGNGGSAANASHFATDLGKGASGALGKRFRILSLNDNVAWMTALANDASYQDVFVEQLRAYAKPGDIAFTMSVSGDSPNVVKAIEWAGQNGLHTVALVGKKRGRLAGLARQVVVVDSEHYGRVEDTHMTICHAICYAFMEKPKTGPTPASAQ